MQMIFADTAFFLALFEESSTAHEAAVKYMRSNSSQLLFTSAIVLELGNALCRGEDRVLFKELLEAFATFSHQPVIHLDEELMEAGIARFHARPDKEWSLTDCISMAVMERNGIVDVLTLDHHFKQAGFNVLLPLADE